MKNKTGDKMKHKRYQMRRTISMASAVSPLTPFGEEIPMVLPNEVFDELDDSIEFAEEMLDKEEYDRLVSDEEDK